ncbi:1-acyl-sn-glycerol-3-phosphate acyltransferase [Eikenella sp. Marseille-P7795]|uniref:1-acyl-sn-glycerol-3-phosphate acyltransferase n=1 Tax=Eikenella sp. Marseille-P7795 TaxID=2866577 RepID=UPI001CE462C7|nr:1-acyl-sn-glycerol-3-phosphate acyltransferase [Eikenella sp. Marseille-P7795]
MMNTQPTSLFTRLFRLLHLLCWFFLTAVSLFRLREYNQHSKDVMQRLARSMLKVLHIRIEANPANPPFPLVFLGAANHVSWLDPMILMAMYPTVFIAKREIRSWPIIGAVVARTGAVFINRNSRNDVAPVNEAIVRSLTAGHSVSFFPETKASEGTGTLPFKAALFQSALDSGLPAVAVALRYCDAAGKRSIGPAYAGNTSLFTSLWRIVSMPEIIVRADCSAPLALTAEEAADPSARFLLKDKTEAFVGGVVNGGD